MLSKKHFTALANAIAIDYCEPRRTGTDSLRKQADAERGAIRRTAERVADVCEGENPRFDRAKFLTVALPERVPVSLDRSAA